MEDLIFFKDTTNKLKGPFTERQVQEWYRKDLFEDSFPFYFTRNDEFPSEEDDSGITLDSLCNLNGIGCPFKRVDGKGKVELEEEKRDREERLERIKKEIVELRKKCEAVLYIEKTIERVQKSMENWPRLQKEVAPNTVEKESPKEQNLPIETVSSESNRNQKKKNKKKKNNQEEIQSVTSNPKKIQETAIVKPDSIPDDTWQSFYELGSSVADFVMDAIEVFATGRFKSWDKNRVKIMVSALNAVNDKEHNGRNVVCEHILIEKMKEKEFYCCSICEDEAFFNYKQTLIHFSSNEHCNMETTAVRDSGVNKFRAILDLFTNLPLRLAYFDEEKEENRRRRNGPVNMMKRIAQLYRPDDFEFPKKMKLGYCAVHNDNMNKYSRADIARLSPTVFNTMYEVELAKGPFGVKTLTEVHEHLGEGETYCSFCDCVTGDRNGFYDHFVSSSHLRGVANALKRIGNESRTDFLTIIVNVHRKDLI